MVNIHNQWVSLKNFGRKHVFKIMVLGQSRETGAEPVTPNQIKLYNTIILIFHQ